MTVLESGSFHLWFCNLLRLLVCAFYVRFLLSRISVVEFLFHFFFVFVGLAFDVSSSCFCMILDSCVALLTASLSFPFFPVRRPFLFSSCSFGVVVFFFLSGGFLLGFPGVVHYFPILFDLLVIRSSVFLQLCRFLFRNLRRLPSGFLRLLGFLWGFSESSSALLRSHSQLSLPILSDAFSLVLGFSALGIILRVWSACGVSFSVCILICCDCMRRAFALLAPCWSLLMSPSCRCFGGGPTSLLFS